MKQLIIILVFACLGLNLFGQVVDSANAAVATDSSSVPVKKDTVLYVNKAAHTLYGQQAWYDLKRPSEAMVELKRMPASGKAWLFWTLTSLALFFGIMRALFPRYFNTLFKVFFNTTLRQNQLTDQLSQSSLPALLLNIFHVIVTSIFVFLAFREGMAKNWSAWQILGIIGAGIAFIYIIKSGVIKLAGWLTNTGLVGDMYLFNVMLINKILAIGLFPLLFFMAFGNNSIKQIAIITGFILVLVLLVTRLYKSYYLTSQSLKLNPLQFIMLIFSLEILPIMILAKGLMLYFN